MKRLYFTIFLVSCSLLMFEVSLIRLFSIYLSYHFAFMVISIAMLGTGSAGTLLALSKERCSGVSAHLSITSIARYSRKSPFLPKKH